MCKKCDKALEAYKNATAPALRAYLKARASAEEAYKKEIAKCKG
jgi:hypothetical protein